MARALFRRQLKVALVPFIAFLAFWAAAIVHFGKSEGSAADGEVRDGKYFLSLGHGKFQETSKERFYVIRHRERIVLVCLGGMAVSLAVAAYKIKRAGLPLRIK